MKIQYHDVVAVVIVVWKEMKKKRKHVIVSHKNLNKSILISTNENDILNLSWDFFLYFFCLLLHRWRRRRRREIVAKYVKKISLNYIFFVSFLITFFFFFDGLSKVECLYHMQICFNRFFLAQSLKFMKKWNFMVILNRF